MCCYDKGPSNHERSKYFPSYSTRLGWRTAGERALFRNPSMVRSTMKLHWRHGTSAKGAA